MANQNVAQSPEQILKNDKLECVMDAIVERDEQLYALASSVLMHLAPKDEKNIPDDHPLTAWRLAQVLDEMLSSTSHTCFVRAMLLPPESQAKNS